MLKTTDNLVSEMNIYNYVDTVSVEDKPQKFHPIFEENQDDGQMSAQSQDIIRSEEDPDQYVPNPVEIVWKNIKIDAEVNQEIITPQGKKKTVRGRKEIIHDMSGSIKPGEFTAILGPSGCGKTTLLNFLSGRLIGSNLEVTGHLMLNGEEIQDIDDYSNEISYVMQDDILLATFTPQEAFQLTADLRLRHLNEKQKASRVHRLIKELGLTRCKNTKVGNSLIRGVSGGERKRTSIGVELLTNPSLLFLDEPTTGLDSSTALQVIELLKGLSRRGVNVISTIHQPSSEIFNAFQRLILICKGHILYQGISSQSVGYFEKLGFACPDFSNPSDYFMKLMNEEGLHVELNQKGQKTIDDKSLHQMFDKRVLQFVAAYQASDMAVQQKPTITHHLDKDDDSFNVSLPRQFYLLSKRSMISQIRNPMDVMMKTVQTIVFAIACIIVFTPLGDGTSGFQNRAGVLQFLGSTMAFSSIQGSISTFSSERQIFIRERLSRSYSVGPYFWGKNLAEMPFQLLFPILLTVITYYSIGLNDNSFSQFIILNVIMICTFFYGTSYGLIISVAIPKLEVAMALLPITIIPLMVLGGYFVNSNNIPKFLIWIEYISMFKYSFQAAALNEFDTLNFNPGTIDPLKELGIKEDILTNILILIGCGIICRFIAYFLLYFISTPTKPKLNQRKFKNI